MQAKISDKMISFEFLTDHHHNHCHGYRMDHDGRKSVGRFAKREILSWLSWIPVLVTLVFLEGTRTKATGDTIATARFSEPQTITIPWKNTISSKYTGSIP